MPQRTFTDAFIRGLKPKDKPYKLAEAAPKGEGRLVVRVLPTGTKEFFYRYRVNGLDKTLALGRYDATGKSGKTLEKIRNDRKNGLAAVREHQRSTGDVKAFLEAENRRLEVEKRKGTLSQLLAAYVDALKAAGKPSWKQAQGCFERNVLKPFPSLALAKAAQVEPGDIQRVLARMVKAGITRQVNVTRSYLRAAFQWGAHADHDPRTVAAEGVLFGIKANPVAAVRKIAEYENAGERALTDEELRHYWNTLEELPVVQRATLRFNLALANQRPTQLLRADWKAFELVSEKTLLLKDSKGRGGSRDHLLPLTEFAIEQLKPLRELNADAPSPFTTDGKRTMALETLSTSVATISASLEKKGIPAFQQRDLRRTAETMLQKLGIDKEVRAHLMSHGRSQGVQAKHYERYDFLDEKRQALERWAAHLQRVLSGKSAGKVVAIR